MPIAELLERLREKFSLVYCVASDADAKVLASSGNRSELHWDSLLTQLLDDEEAIARVFYSLEEVGQSDRYGQGDVRGILVRAAPRLVIACFKHCAHRDFSFDEKSDEIAQLIAASLDSES
jgi:hypothetical protein